jgi:predicted transcriptional regulator
MINKDLFSLNPDENNLLNDGVVEINTAKDEQGLRIIRHELKTFVCEGEYQRGITRILETYLKHFDQPKQPAVWVSGFFGSGKSHLVKMLGYLWEDFKLSNDESARTIKPLPKDVTDLLVELDRKQHKFGKLSVSGTLKDFPSADIRSSFLQLFLSALDLPPLFHHFKFIYWTKKEGIYDQLKAMLEAQGSSLKAEYENMFVSSLLAKAILQLKPEFAENEAKVKENFKANFGRVDNLSREQFINTIREEALPLVFGDNIPCTIIVLDEVQQFIGQDGNKTIDIQNLAQDICSSFDGKFLLVGTGQNALSETPQLQPLQDRFSVKVLLSDTDVETVTRKTVLEKKPSAIAVLEKKLEDSLGEISRNLEGTDYSYRSEDRANLVADYPILPSTRKFWKKIFQAIDKAGTSGQLRSQLRIVDISVKQVAHQELGSIVPADFIYDQKRQQLIQNAILLKETENLILERLAKGGDSALEGRILSVVFLLDQLPKDVPGGRLKSDEKTIADLMLDNLNTASDNWRNKIKQLIHHLADVDQVLMRVNDEFKLQTKTGAEWEQEYTAHVVKLNNAGEDQIQHLRQEKTIAFFKDISKNINILHGQSKQKRDFDLWDKTEPPPTDNKLNLWIRDGWSENQALVLNEIRAEGADSPLAYAFVNKMRDQDLRGEIVKYLAAKLTLQSKGTPSSPEGQQAQKSMDTRMRMAEEAIKDLVAKICAETTVYLAGGAKVDAGAVRENIEEALNRLADRQFPDFKSKADFKNWDKALVKAFSGDPDALKRIEWEKDAHDHPIALDILRFIGNAKKSGKEIRNHFMKAPYGWSQDAIDTMLVALCNTEHLSTPETNLNQSKINAALFKKEVHTLTAKDKILLRQQFQSADISCQPNQEFQASNQYLDKLIKLAQLVSGDAPKPEPFSVAFLQDIQNLDGNERLLRMLEERVDLQAKYEDWTAKKLLLEQRQFSWSQLEQLIIYAPANAEIDELRKEIDAIRYDRLLYREPDPIQPLLSELTEKMRNELNDLKNRFISAYDAKMAEVQSSEYFSKLTPEQKNGIFSRHQLLGKPEVKAANAQELLNQLQKTTLDGWLTKIAALPGQFQAALEDAVQLTTPHATTFSLPRRTLHNQSDIDAYLAQLKTDLEKALKDAGLIVLK